MQLLLDLPPPPLALDDFVAGGNGLLLSALRAMLAGTGGDTSLYVWGDIGSGKTHLLHASVADAHKSGWIAGYMDCRQQCLKQELADHSWLAVDNIHLLDEEGQFELFALFNRCREQGSVLIMAGAHSPSQIPLRADLKTRLGWSPSYQLQPLSDEEKVAALCRHAQRRGFELPADAANYLLNHLPRDMHSLSTALDAIDRESLTHHRTITLPLIRQALADSNLF